MGQALLVYVILGTLFAAPFVAKGVNRVDPAARTASWAFRLLILPGAIALWPLLAAKWWRTRA
jgi:hypothetical protein